MNRDDTEDKEVWTDMRPLLANLDRLSDEKVDTLLADMLADEKVSE